MSGEFVTVNVDKTHDFLKYKNQILFVCKSGIFI